jgi:hypothetical protein
MELVRVRELLAAGRIVHETGERLLSTVAPILGAAAVVDVHGAKLVQGELHTVAADSFVTVEHGAWAVESNTKCDDGQEWCEDDKRDGGPEEVNRALRRVAPDARPQRWHANERETLHLMDECTGPDRVE